MTSRPNKRIRIAQEGGSSYDFVPLANDDYRDVHSRESSLRRLGTTVLTLQAPRVSQKSSEEWRTTTSWAPLDDPGFGLDPDGDWYDEALDAHVMQDDPPPAIGLAESKKKVRSKVSVSRLSFSSLQGLIFQTSHRNALMSYGKSFIVPATSMKSAA